MNPRYTSLDTWQKDCEICNVGLCNRIDGLKDEGKSIREAARIMESESDGLWDADKIRARYKYYKGGRKPPIQEIPPIAFTQPVDNPKAYPPSSEVKPSEMGTTNGTVPKPEPMVEDRTDRIIKRIKEKMRYQYRIEGEFKEAINMMIGAIQNAKGHHNWYPTLKGDVSRCLQHLRVAIDPPPPKPTEPTELEKEFAKNDEGIAEYASSLVVNSKIIKKMRAGDFLETSKLTRLSGENIVFVNVTINRMRDNGP